MLDRELNRIEATHRCVPTLRVMGSTIDDAGDWSGSHLSIYGCEDCAPLQRRAIAAHYPYTFVVPLPRRLPAQEAFDFEAAS